MITPTDVQRVAFTANSHTDPDTGATLTIDDVVKLTTAKDWDGALYQLGDTAAAEIARQFNATHAVPKPITRGRKPVKPTDN